MARAVWNERVRAATRVTIQCAPPIAAMGLLVAWSEDALSIRNVVSASVTALIVGLPWVFLVSIAVQIFPRSWYEK